MSLWKIDGNGRLELDLHPGQTKVWQSRKRFVFMLAGTQGGKTSLGPWWLWREIYGGNDFEGRGPGDYIAATASIDLYKLKMLPEIRSVFEHVLKLGRWWAGDKVLELRDPDTGKFWANRADDPMWGRIILRSSQAEGGLESATGKGAWLDECGQNKFQLGDWEAVLRRLSLHQGRVLGTTTIYNMGWLKSQVYDAWKRGDPDFDVVQFKSTLNPMFPQAEYERARRTMQRWKLRMFYEGEFDRPAGMIYDVFDENLHVIDPIPIPRSWPRAVGIDPVGAVISAHWAAFDLNTNRLHIFREYYEGYGKTTAEHARDILKASSGERVVKWTGGGPSERQARLDWRASGIPLEAPPITDVESGIDLIYALLKSFTIVIHRNCKHLIDDLGSYARKLDSNDEPTEKIENKDAYHAADSTRYLIAGISQPATTEEVISLIRPI